MSWPALIIESNNLLTDNPWLYEHMFPEPDDASGRFIAEMLRRHESGPRVLDVGSGLGREVAYLNRQGWDAIGLECAPHMLAYARAAYGAERFVDGVMQQFDLGQRFDAITCIDSAFLYNERNTDLVATLRCFRQHLSPNGLLLLEMRNGAYLLGNARWLAAEHTDMIKLDDRVIHARTRYHIDHGAQLLCRTRSWELPDRDAPVTQTSAWRLLFPQEVCLLLAQTGFEVCALFDGPGPHAEAEWVHDDLPLHTTLHNRRLHVIARKASA